MLNELDEPTLPLADVQNNDRAFANRTRAIVGYRFLGNRVTPSNNCRDRNRTPQVGNAIAQVFRLLQRRQPYSRIRSSREKSTINISSSISKPTMERTCQIRDKTGYHRTLISFSFRRKINFPSMIFSAEI